MKIRIQSDGAGPTTHVTNAETGEEIEGVISATWTCEARGPARVVLTLIPVAPVDVVGEAE